MHTPNPGYIPGDHWMECDICGFDYRYSQMRPNWRGQWVCKKDWEPRHPQDFVRGREDKIAPPVSRKGTTDNTHTAGSVTPDDL